MTRLSVVASEIPMEQGQFEIIRSLGSGATAEVFKARNKETDKFVALKSFLNFISQDEEALKRLRDEIEILKSFDHPNVVKLFGEHMHGSQLCLELELVEGHHLRDWMSTSRNPLLEVDLWILVQVARGLGAVHEKGIIHRDLKPENVLISKNGEVKLSDFGLAKELNRLTMTRLGLLVGSLGYMAPEVTEGEKACIKSDLFSFGAIAYELISGQPPIHGDTAQAILKKAMEPVEPLAHVCPHVSPRVARVVDHCLKLEKEDRPESIWAVESELMGVLNQSGLLPKCRELLKENPRADVLKSALTTKRESLLKETEKIKNDKKRDKKKLLSLANEFQRLFPEDTTGIELLALLRDEKGISWKHPLIVAPVFLGVFAMAFVFMVDWTSFGGGGTTAPVQLDKKPVTLVSNKRIKVVKPSAEAKQMNKPVVAKTKTPVKPAAPKPMVEKPAPKKGAPTPKIAHGFLSFEVDADVSIQVDGRKIPKEELKKIKLNPGVHKVRMEKEGFDPINNEIQIKAGKITRIRAKGGA